MSETKKSKIKKSLFSIIVFIVVLILAFYSLSLFLGPQHAKEPPVSTSTTCTNLSTSTETQTAYSVQVVKALCDSHTLTSYQNYTCIAGYSQPPSYFVPMDCLKQSDYNTDSYYSTIYEKGTTNMSIISTQVTSQGYNYVFAHAFQWPSNLVTGQPNGPYELFPDHLLFLTSETQSATLIQYSTVKIQYQIFVTGIFFQTNNTNYFSSYCESFAQSNLEYPLILNSTSCVIGPSYNLILVGNPTFYK